MFLSKRSFWLLFSLACAVLVLFLVSVAFHFLSPTVTGTSLERFQQKISSNAPITIRFRQLMDRASVEESFMLSPQASGRFSWFFNSLTFSPEERFNVGQTYTLTVSKNAKNILGRPLEKDYVVQFSVLDPPRVLLAVPKDETSVDSKITVMFDRPMVELTTLDESESREIPFHIDPAIPGKFKWIGTSAFQYIPKDRFAYSTHYTVTIPLGLSSLDGGKLTEAYVFSFRTPRIAIHDSKQRLSANSPYILSFSPQQEVDIESVKKHTKVKTSEGKDIPLRFRHPKWKEKKGQKEKEVEARYTVEILPAKDDWGYDNGYTIEVSKGISGLEGNLTTETEIKADFRTTPFLVSKFPEEKDGVVSSTPDIRLDFDQAVDLGSVRNNFSLSPEADFKANYGKKCDPKWEPKESPDEKCPEIEDETKIIFTPKKALQNRKQYEGRLKKNMKAKNGLSYLKEDVSWKFLVADVLRVAGNNLKPDGTSSPRRLCLFTNNLVEQKDLEKHISFQPAVKAKIFASSYEFFPSITPSYKDQRFLACEPRQNEGRFIIEIQAFLNPSTSYEMLLKGTIKDIFQQSLGSDFILRFKTDVLSDQDTDLNLVQRNFYAVVTKDQHAAPVFSTQNLDEFDFEICRISTDQFMKVDTEQVRFADTPAAYEGKFGWNNFEPSENHCVEYKKIKKKVKNVYWETQYTEISLEQELNTAPNPGYYLLRASSPRVYSMLPKYTYDEQFKTSKQIGEEKVFHRPTQLLLLTNTHMTVKSARDNAIFWVTDLTTGKPVEGVKIKLLSAHGSDLSLETTTDGQGIAEKDLKDLPFQYAIASYGDEEVVVNADWSNGISPWDYQLTYSRLERYIQGYLYTERPLYQPTHEVFFKGILREDRDRELRMPKEKSIEVEILDSRGASIYKKPHQINAQGTFSGSLKLDEKAPLGRYTISTCIRKTQDLICTDGFFQAFFFVEEYRKPEYKLEATFSKDSYVDREQLQVNLNAQYFFGAPVPQGKVQWNLLAQNYYFDEYKEEWFSFTDHETFRKCYFGCPYEDKLIDGSDGWLDENGKMTITHKIDLRTQDEEGKKKPPDTSKIYTLSATVQDKNNQSVAVNQSVIVHRSQFYVGVKNEEYIVSAGGKMPIKVITVNPKGAPVGGEKVKLELKKLEWKYVKKKNVDGGFYWENELDEKSIDTSSLRTGDDGKARHEFRVPEGGEYLVRATIEDSLGNTVSSTVDFYATTEKIVHWKQENNNRMELKLDKVSYALGEKAKVLVKSPYKDVKALLTYERGKIMEAKVIDIPSNAYVIEVPITEEMIPNFYVSVLVVKGGTKVDLPDFKLGYANVLVEAKSKELDISIKTDKKRYEPRQRVNVEITAKDSKGNPVPADISIAAVDASLLALKGNPKRDLINVFYNRRSLGVSTADNMTNFLERVNLSDLKGAKGGSGKGADEFGKARGKFEDTAFWRSNLSTDANGRLSTSFALPDNLTTWNIEVIGGTADSKFGAANETITTQKAVMVRPVLPRFGLFFDEIRLGAIVHNFTQRDRIFSVSIKTENLELLEKSVKKVAIPAEGSQKVLWKTKVPKVFEGTRALVTFSASSNEWEDSVRQDFPLHTYATPETVSTSSFTDDVSFTEKVVLPSTIDPTLGELNIKTGATLATYLSDSLNYLLSFPYGCTEQLMSRLVPNIVLKNAVNLPHLKDKLKLADIRDEKGNIIPFDTVVSLVLQRLYEYQRPDGSWGYFPGSREGYPYLTAYIVFGLEQLQKGGYAIDDRVLQRSISYLQDFMLENRDLKDSFTGKLREKTSYWANNRAYLLFILAETGRKEVALAKSLYEDRKLLSNAGKAYLAMALQKVSEESQGKIDRLIQELENQIRIDTRGAYLRYDGGSSFEMMTHTKVTSIAIQALNRIEPKHPLLPKLVKWLIAARKNGRWDTTQENVSALIALTEFLEKSKETEASYKAKIIVNEKTLKQYTVSSDTILNFEEVQQAISELKTAGASNTVVFSKDGKGRLYYDMVLRYFLPVDSIASRSEGFTIERKYYRLDDKKLEKPISQAKAGETLRGRLSIVVPEQRYAVALENFLPAGFELVNFEFSTSDLSLRALPNQSESEAMLPQLPPLPNPPQSEAMLPSLQMPIVLSPKPPDCYGCYSQGGLGFGADGYFYGISPWTHKEVRHDRLFLFADALPKGVYEYDYYVQVANEGKFHHPPAIISEMYFPENFGRTKGEWMEVNE